MIPSVLCNLAMAAAAVAAVWTHSRKAPLRVVLRYFTVLSNLLCALASLTAAVCRLCGGLPAGAALLKYAGTASVTVTLLTVLFFLGPTIGYKLMLTGPDFWLHLVCPLLALLSYFLWDRPAAGPAVVLLAVAPVALYGAMYLYRVLFAPEEKRWNDFYGFNRGGRWYLSFGVMLAASALIGFALYAVQL